MNQQPPARHTGATARLWAAPAALLALAALAAGIWAHSARAQDDDDVSSGPAQEYRLDRLPILSRVIIHVKDNYVDPKRIDPKGMIVAAMDTVEKTVAEVMVDGDAKSGKLVVTVGTAQKTFDISDVDSIWKITPVMQDIMGFVEKNLVKKDNLRDIEYAAVNGMLSTLDPHSVMLEPKYFKEMKLKTKGEFGGLGFVIQMRDGNLTVVRVLKGTPAQRAGVKPKDVITKIEEQSTVNMDLQDAVDHLRGKPNTKVSITIARAGEPPRKLPLVREIINVESVPQARLLDNGVGYVRISEFSANTTRELYNALQQQQAQAGGKLKGLVLDLRGNPGGLLEQAIQVSDLFLSDGTIVSTVGEGDRVRIHEVKEAHADRDDMTSLPIVVLVNNGSASASEIVTGALKNNNRAIVMGRQTFGKGSVQVLYDFQDPSKPSEESALKLTIAQYLTPCPPGQTCENGGQSIQEVGVTPDVMLVPGRILKDSVNYFAPPRSSGEVDLDHHFENPGDAALSQAEKDKREAERKKRVEKSPLELRYVMDEKEDKLAQQLKKDAKKEADRKARATAKKEAGKAGKADDSSDDMDLTPEEQEEQDLAADEGEFVEDYQIRFAKEFLAAAPYASRPQQLEAAKAFVAQRQAEEQKRVEDELKVLGVDWATGPATGTPRAVVSVTPVAGQKELAGDTMQWQVTVENQGDGPFHQLRAWTRDDKNPLLDRREFVFGLVKPGEKKTWTVPVKLPKSLDSRRDEVTIHFADDGTPAPADVKTAVDVVQLPHPLFAFSTQVEDADGGNGDGVIEKGEKVTLRVDVKNAGPGKSGEKTYALLKNLGDDKIFIEKGRYVLGTIKPGESKPATFSFEVKKGLKGDTVPLRVMIVDERMDEYVTEKLELPALNAGTAAAPKKGALHVLADATIRSGGDKSTQPIATAKKGAVLPVAAKAGGFYKVEWAKGRYGFVADDASVRASPAGRLSGQIAEVWQREPPRIALAADPMKAPQVTDQDHFHLEGSASITPPVMQGEKLRDVFVFVNDQKVFFKVVPDKAGAASKLDFSTDVPLKPGQNAVTVFAREDDEFQTRKTLMVYRADAGTQVHAEK